MSIPVNKEIKNNDSSEVIKSIASSLKSKVMERENKHSERLFGQRHSTKKTDITTSTNVLTPSMLNIFEPKTSFLKNCLNKQKESKESIKNARIQKNLDKIKRSNNLDRSKSKSKIPTSYELHTMNNKHNPNIHVAEISIKTSRPENRIGSAERQKVKRIFP